MNPREKTASPEDLSQKISALRNFSRQLVRELGYLRTPVAGSDLSPSAVHTLLELGMQPGMLARDLATALRLDKSNASRQISKMESQGLLRRESEASPVQDRRLILTADLFAADALILDRVASRRLDYGPPGGPKLYFGFHGFDVLGLWSKPGAGFLCIEPWSGFHSPEGWEGELADKPGILTIPPSGCFEAGWTVDLAPA